MNMFHEHRKFSKLGEGPGTDLIPLPHWEVLDLFITGLYPTHP